MRTGTWHSVHIAYPRLTLFPPLQLRSAHTRAPSYFRSAHVSCGWETCAAQRLKSDGMDGENEEKKSVRGDNVGTHIQRKGGGK